MLTKDIIRKQQFNIYSDEICPGWRVWGNTGGSTGEPLKFPRNSNGLFNEAVCQYITYDYLNNFGGVRASDIIISISGERISEEKLKKKLFYNEGGNFPWGKYSFSTLYMTEDLLSYYVEKCCFFIRGYSAGILTLAQYVTKHNVSLRILLKC